MAPSKPKMFFGCSGWHYDDWKGAFYPEDLPKRRWLEYYADHFDTVEINNTFYRLPKESTFEKWYKEGPEDFIFTLKGSRYITHVKKLNDPKEPVKTFYNLADILQEKLGCILWQLPPNQHKDEDKLKIFCKALSTNYKNVIEFRHESWFSEDIYEILEEYKVAFCAVSTPTLPETLAVTAPFAYIRFHGKASEWYKYNYSDKELKEWKDKIKNVKEANEIFIYFNNDYEANAIKNCDSLKNILK